MNETTPSIPLILIPILLSIVVHIIIGKYKGFTRLLSYLEIFVSAVISGMILILVLYLQLGYFDSFFINAFTGITFISAIISFLIKLSFELLEKKTKIGIPTLIASGSVLLLITTFLIAPSMIQKNRLKSAQNKYLNYFCEIGKIIEPNINKVSSGMTEKEVIDLLGDPNYFDKIEQCATYYLVKEIYWGDAFYNVKGVFLRLWYKEDKISKVEIDKDGFVHVDFVNWDSFIDHVNMYCKH